MELSNSKMAPQSLEIGRAERNRRRWKKSAKFDLLSFSTVRFWPAFSFFRSRRPFILLFFLVPIFCSFAMEAATAPLSARKPMAVAEERTNEKWKKHGRRNRKNQIQKPTPLTWHLFNHSFYLKKKQTNLWKAIKINEILSTPVRERNGEVGVAAERANRVTSSDRFVLARYRVLPSFFFHSTTNTRVFTFTGCCRGK